ncbi:MAG: hypothetical protein K6F97_12240 [Lachnospiraceae bacterium]|nr:hypothetical protein [Lachnospiraceae bacterium]
MRKEKKMNKIVNLIIWLIVIVSYAGVLLSVTFDWGGKIETVCCGIAALGTLILFKSKKMRKRETVDENRN